MTDNIPKPVAASADLFAEGLEKLLRMKPLDEFDFDRWAQIRRDCTKLLKNYGSQIREYGWELSDVFGYRRGAHIKACGLGLYLSGGTVTRFKPRDVLVWKPVSQGMGGKWTRHSGWAKPRLPPLIWEGAEVDGPVWHCPRHRPVSPPVAAPVPVQPALPIPEPPAMPKLLMPAHVFAAITGPSCLVH